MRRGFRNPHLVSCIDQKAFLPVTSSLAVTRYPNQEVGCTYAVFNTENQQGPAVQRGELCSMSRGSRDGRAVWGRMDACIRMPESLRCPPETITTLLISYAVFQSLTYLRVFATPWTAARQASLSITNSRSLLKLMPIELVMPSSHLILCRPLLLLPPIPPSIRIFSNESTLCMR